MNNTSTEAGPCLKLQDAAGTEESSPYLHQNIWLLEIICNGKSLQDTEVYS